MTDLEWSPWVVPDTTPAITVRLSRSTVIFLQQNLWKNSKVEETGWDCNTFSRKIIIFRSTLNFFVDRVSFLIQCVCGEQYFSFQKKTCQFNLFCANSFQCNWHPKVFSCCFGAAKLAIIYFAEPPWVYSVATWFSSRWAAWTVGPVWVLCRSRALLLLACVTCLRPASRRTIMFHHYFLFFFYLLFRVYLWHTNHKLHTSWSLFSSSFVPFSLTWCLELKKLN